MNFWTIDVLLAVGLVSFPFAAALRLYEFKIVLPMGQTEGWYGEDERALSWSWYILPWLGYLLFSALIGYALVVYTKEPLVPWFACLAVANYAYHLVCATCRRAQLVKILELDDDQGQEQSQSSDPSNKVGRRSSFQELVYSLVVLLILFAPMSGPVAIVFAEGRYMRALCQVVETDGVTQRKTITVACVNAIQREGTTWFEITPEFEDGVIYQIQENPDHNNRLMSWSRNAEHRAKGRCQLLEVQWNASDRVDVTPGGATVQSVALAERVTLQRVLVEL